ncbi:hypothetical protein [Sinomonas soli]
MKITPALILLAAASLALTSCGTAERPPSDPEAIKSTCQVAQVVIIASDNFSSKGPDYIDKARQILDDQRAEGPWELDDMLARMSQGLKVEANYRRGKATLEEADAALEGLKGGSDTFDRYCKKT